MKVKKRLPTYYKTECLDCELILSVRWERMYFGALPTFQRETQQKNVSSQKVWVNLPKPVRFFQQNLENIQKNCPFCQGIRIKMAKINEEEYLRINEQWDIRGYFENVKKK